VTRAVRRRARGAISRLLAVGLFEGRAVLQRGRWWNPVVGGSHALFKRLPPLKGVDEPAFIIGMGRTGTTLLGRLLSLHPQVAYLNEPKALWHAACPFEDLQGSFSDGECKLYLDAGDVTTDMRRCLTRVYGAYLALMFADRIVDKYPELVYRAALVKEVFPDAKFLLMVRRGWDATSSVVRWSRRHAVVDGNGHKRDWWGVEDRKWKILVDQVGRNDPALVGIAASFPGVVSDANRAAFEWTAAMRAGRRVALRWPECVLTVRYEELVGEARGTLERVTSFLGLSYDPELLERADSSIRTPASSEPFDVHDRLSEAFEQTMSDLGYR
jgi:hypothetical protein